MFYIMLEHATYIVLNLIAYETLFLYQSVSLRRETPPRPPETRVIGRNHTACIVVELIYIVCPFDLLLYRHLQTINYR